MSKNDAGKPLFGFDIAKVQRKNPNSIAWIELGMFWE